MLCFLVTERKCTGGRYGDGGEHKEVFERPEVRHGWATTHIAEAGVVKHGQEPNVERLFMDGRKNSPQCPLMNGRLLKKWHRVMTQQTERDPQTLEKKPPTFSGCSQSYSEDVGEPGRLVQ